MVKGKKNQTKPKSTKEKQTLKEIMPKPSNNNEQGIPPEK